MLDMIKAARFDPAETFRSKYGDHPWDLLKVLAAVKIGWDIFVEAESISPPLDDKVYVSFTSSKVTLSPGDIIGFEGAEVSILDATSLKSKKLKAKEISQETFLSAIERNV